MNRIKMFLCRLAVIASFICFCCNASEISIRDAQESEKLESISRKVDLIITKLDTFDSQLNGQRSLDNLESKLDVVISKLDALSVRVGGSTGGAVTAQTAAGGETQNIVRLISVERTPGPDGNRFRLRFQRNVDNLFFRYHDVPGPAKIPLMESEGDQEVAVFDCRPPENMRGCWVVIMDEEFGETEFLRQRSSMSLGLNNTDVTPAFYEFPDLPVLQVEPQDVVYEPGRDINVTGFFHWTDEGRVHNINLWNSFNGVDLSTGEFFMHFDRDRLFSTDEKSDTDEKCERRVTLATSTVPVSGFLEFIIDKEMRGGELVDKIQIHRFARVRPSNQTKVVPPGYLAFADQYGQESPDGNELASVELGEKQSIFCYAVGDVVTGINAFQVLPDGTLEPVTSLQRSPQSTRSFGAVYWTFEATEDSSDRNLTTFQCVASDDVHGQTRTKLIDVQTTIKARIDPARSNLTIESVPSEPELRRLTFQCAVTGKPIPDDIYFSAGLNQHYIPYYDSPDNVLTTGPHSALATLSVDVHISTLRDQIRDINSGLDESPDCGFYSYSGFERFSYELPQSLLN